MSLFIRFAILTLLFHASFVRAEFKNESEAGVVIASGNSSSQSLNFRQDDSYRWEENTLVFRGNFLQSKSLGVLSAKRWDSQLRYERAISARWSFFLSQGVESDRFAGFMQKYNSDLGAKYFLRKTAAFVWFGELGYRYSRERLLDSSHDNKQQARVYSEAQRNWSDTVSSKLWVEYLPNFTRTSDWELNGEFSTSAALSSILAMKVAYLAKFNHEPNPSVPRQLDSLVTTSLVARY